MVERYPHCDEAIIVHHPPTAAEFQLKIHEKEIVVDPICAAAVLRGAHIYAPGVMAMMAGTGVDNK